VFGPHFSNGSSDLTATRTCGAAAVAPRRAPAPFFASRPAGADRAGFVLVFIAVPVAFFVPGFFVAGFFDFPFTVAGVRTDPDLVPVFPAVSVRARVRPIVPRAFPVTLRSPVTPVPFLTFPTCSP